MTREEAIETWIKPACKNIWNEKKCKEIFEALEQESDVLDKIRIEINAMPTDYCGGYTGLDKQEVLQVIDKYKAESEEE